MTNENPQNQAKITCARAALAMFVRPEMTIGLGSGSTAEIFVDILAQEVRNGLNIRATATSLATHNLAISSGIEMFVLEALAPLDLCIDGADEIDASLNMIKGGGACHVREKIVAINAKTFVCIADHSKLVGRLGAFSLPVEIVQFANPATIEFLHATITAQPEYAHAKMPLLRQKDGQDLVTDNGNLIADITLGTIHDAKALASIISQVPGVVDHGLFIDIADHAIIGNIDGTSKHLTKASA